MLPCAIVAPAPATWGGKNRAATDDMTAYALKPRIFGTSARMAKPGILELCQSMGKVMGVLPRTEKSKALWVYFQMYSPEKTKWLVMVCWRPAWNSLRKPGWRVVLTPGEQIRSSASTLFPQP